MIIVLRVLRSLSLKLLQVSLLKAEQVKRQEKERVRGSSHFPQHAPPPPHTHASPFLKEYTGFHFITKYISCALY